MTQVQRRAVRGVVTVAGLVLATALVGCQNFFVCDKASCTNNGSGGSTGAAGNVVYVANNVSSILEINGYTLAKPSLTAATGSPYSLGLTPTAMVMSRNNAFLYVASAVTTGSPTSQIFGFSVGTGGSLTLINGITPLASQSSVAAMDVSPDGNWLVVTTANGASSLTSTTITAYPINTTTGFLNAATALPYGVAGSAIISSLKVAPSGEFISVALGLGGVATFPFNTSTGLISTGAITTFGSTTVGASDLAIDSNNLLYVAVTGGISVYTVTISSASAVTLNAITTTPIATASGGPFSIALDGTSYVYASASNNPPSSLIYGFSNKAGVLTPLSTATISAPSSTTKLAVDSTGAYLLAAGYDSSAGLKMYGITSGSGLLTSLDTAATGTTLVVPTVLALSH
jgi:6-phosphogluconolactonase